MPGDATTGSTFLNDLAAGVDVLVLFGVPIVFLVVALWAWIDSGRDDR